MLFTHGGRAAFASLGCRRLAKEHKASSRRIDLAAADTYNIFVPDSAFAMQGFDPSMFTVF